MIHGSSISSNIFQSVFDSDDIKYSLLAMDLPGHGKSEHNGKYLFHELKNRLADLINNINGPKLLIGNSLGGHLAIELLTRVKEVKGIIIFGTPPLKKPVNFQEATAPNPYLSTYLNMSPSKEELETTLSGILNNKEVISIMKEDFLKADPKVRPAMVESPRESFYI